MAKYMRLSKGSLINVSKTSSPVTKAGSAAQNPGGRLIDPSKMPAMRPAKGMKWTKR